MERIAAAAAAARALTRDFVLVARADGIMNGHYDIDEALRRLRAFDDAGADCLYAPLPETTQDLARMCAATRKPVNAIAAGPVYTALSRADFAALGVARISLGSALARATHGVIFAAAKSMFDDGQFTLLAPTVTGAEIDRLLEQAARSRT